MSVLLNWLPLHSHAVIIIEILNCSWLRAFFHGFPSNAQTTILLISPVFPIWKSCCPDMFLSSIHQRKTSSPVFHLKLSPFFFLSKSIRSNTDLFSFVCRLPYLAFYSLIFGSFKHLPDMIYRFRCICRSMAVMYFKHDP